jgi:phosphopantetheinyl transferase (holo-ACP synthase)
MKQNPAFSRCIDRIEKEEFVSLFLSCNAESWFSPRELQEFSFPKNARSLAGRYLIKKTICEYIRENEKMHDIEILNDDFGKPEVLLSSDIGHLIELAGIKKILCSISHSRNLIIGMTIFCF